MVAGVAGEGGLGFEGGFYRGLVGGGSGDQVEVERVGAFEGGQQVGDQGISLVDNVVRVDPAGRLPLGEAGHRGGGVVDGDEVQ
ncbi:hypothetical protein NONI108955_32525 [Nocardia ninae]